MLSDTAPQPLVCTRKTRPNLTKSLMYRVAEIGLQRIKDLRNRDAQCFGALPIHLGEDSRSTDAKLVPMAPIAGFCRALVQTPAPPPRIEVTAAGILELYGKPARRTESADRRRVKGRINASGIFANSP